MTDTTPPLPLPALSALAAAATPGTWRWGTGAFDEGSLVSGAPGDEKDTVLMAAPCGHENSYVVASEADADYIAAMSPSTTLALIERIAALEEALDMALRAGEGANGSTQGYNVIRATMLETARKVLGR